MKWTVQTMLDALRAAGVEDACEEFLFAQPQRRWRLDWAWPDRHVGFELEGLLKQRAGRHQTYEGQSRDIEKYNEAKLRGWLVIQATPRQVATGQALAWLCRALGVELGRTSPGCV